MTIDLKKPQDFTNPNILRKAETKLWPKLHSSTIFFLARSDINNKAMC